MNKRIFLIIFFVIVLLIGYVVHDSIRTTNSLKKAMLDDPQSYTLNCPTSYKTLFKNNLNLEFYGSLEGKYRKPISDFYYEKKYQIKVNELDTLYDLPINSIFKYKISDEDPPLNENMDVSISDKLIDIRYKSGKTSDVNRLFLTLYGTNIISIENDNNICYYHLELKNFTLNYNQNQGKEMYCSTDPSNKMLPVELLFLKRDNKLYFIMMYGLKTNIKLPQGILKNLLK